MRTAYILIQRNDVIDPIAPALRAIPGVLVADDVLGPYDAIVLAKHEAIERPVSDVVEEIQRLPGVTRALVASVISQTLSLVDENEMSRVSA